MKKILCNVMLLLAVFLTVSCSSDTKLRESLNEYVNVSTHQLFPTGKIVFDENVIDAGFGKITIELLGQLQDEGLITYTVLENQGSIHEVDVKMTEEGLKYADKTDDNVYIVTLYTCKVGEILEKEFMEEYGKGKCSYSTVYDKVTPFGKILKGIKPGDVCDKKMEERVEKIDGVWQAKWPSWKAPKEKK